MKKFLLFFAAIMLAIPSMLAYHVEFYFMEGIEDSINDPWQYVNVYNTNEDQFSNPDMGYMQYNYTEPCILKIYPGDLDYEIRVSVESAGDYYMDEEDGEYFLTLTEEISGSEITVKVYPAGQAPSDGDKITSVTANFNISAASGSGITDPSNFVEITYYNRSTYTQDDVIINDNFGSASVVPGTQFTVTPANGYEINITSNVEGVASLDAPSDTSTPWTFSINDNPSGDFVSFFVEVAKAPSTFNLAFNGNLNGAEWNQVTVSGIEAPKDDTNNKYKLPAKFTVTPKDGYEITGYSISNGSTKVEDLSAYGSSVTVDNGVYTFDLSEQVNGFTFTLTVEEIVKGTPITFKFTGEGYEHVTVLSGAVVPVPVDNNNYTYPASLPLNLTFSPEENYDLTVTTNAPEDSDVLGNGKGGYTVSIPEDGTIPANFTITIDVFEAVVEPTEVPVTVNFTLELPEGVTSNVVEIIDMNTSLEVTPVDNAFEVTVDPEDEEGVTIQLSVSSDYLFNLEECYVSEGSLITLSPSSDSRILNVEIPYSMKNEDAEVYISVKEAEVGEDIPVNFNVSEYPGLIAGLSFNGKETVITNDSQLENYVVNILEDYEEDALTIVYGKDSEGKLLYTVEKVTAQYVATTEEGLETYSCEVLPFENYCIVSIPADADAVSISFEVKAPTVGVNSLNAVNEDAVIYNIQGVRVNSANLSNGIYVINGKKVIIRK